MAGENGPKEGGFKKMMRKSSRYRGTDVFNVVI